MVFKRMGILVIAVILFTACHPTEHAEEVTPQKIEMPEMQNEIFLPTKLWDIVSGATFTAAVKKAADILFAPIVVRLTEKSEGVLIAPVVQLQFAKGGGEVDWSKYVKGDRGSFQLAFDFDGFKFPKDLTVFFVSKSKKRRIDDELFGSGCRSFFDITPYLLKVNAGEGLKLNVTRDRHDSAVGGYFIFSYKQDKQTFVSAVNFLDSKRPDLFCEEKRK